MKNREKDTLNACIKLLEATLGTMNAADADAVVRGVIAILKAEASQVEKDRS